MAQKKLPRPGAKELAILRVLWDHGPCTVRQVWEQLEHGHQVGYTTVLKQLQTLQEKGFVSCDDRARSNIYQAKITEEDTQHGAAIELIAKLYRGSTSKLILQVLSDKKASREDLLEIRQMIDEMVRRK